METNRKTVISIYKKQKLQVQLLGMILLNTVDFDKPDEALKPYVEFKK